jgi:aspartyl-tRNA(Asn)/glutamyl-tRNA(Gln) amidotransferase subunit A
MKVPLGIEDIREGLAKGDFSCVELVDYYLERIRQYDGKVKAFLTITEEEAFKKAKKDDNLLSDLGKKAFDQFPLLGSVVAHKDLFLTKDIRTTAASKVLKNYYPAYSATVVERLENAGAIMIGKLNCDAWAHGSSGENSDFFATKNPWNENYVPGGSSSGSAAAVSSGFCTYATGTDTCGSIRLPANYCGVVGLKPTYGAVSRYGIIAMASSLDSVGHITLNSSDSEIVYKVTKGSDGKDATLKDFRFRHSGKKAVIGIPKEFFVKGISAEVDKKVKEAIEIFKEAGYKTRQVSLPHMKYGISVYYIIQPAEVSSNLGRYDGVRYGESRDCFGEEAKRRIMLGTYVLSAGYYDAFYLKAMKVRSIIIKEVKEAFDKVDVMIAPVAPTPPFKFGARINNPLEMYLTDIYAATANLAGIPSLALPYGFSKDNLPLGFQIMGPRFSEPLLFEIGKDFEELSGFNAKVAYSGA